LLSEIITIVNQAFSIKNENIIAKNEVFRLIILFLFNIQSRAMSEVRLLR